MTNAQYKRTDLLDEYLEADPALVSWPAELLSGPWATTCRSADSVLAAKRVLLTQHTGGSDSWLVGNGSTGGGTQAYPDPDAYRIVQRARVELTPGSGLEIRALAEPSGATEVYVAGTGTWEFYGAAGWLRISIDFDNIAADNDALLAQWALPTNAEAEGVEDTADAASWAALLQVAALEQRPAAAYNSQAEAAKWAEDTTVTITVEHRGGLRLIHVTVSEVPIEHVVLHTREAVTAHTYPESLDHPDKRPLEESPDGATYEEHRHGTLRMLQASSRQSARLGPIVANWSAYAEGLESVSATEATAVQVTSSTFVGLSVGSAITAWDADAPGHDIAGGYARRAPEHLDTRVDGAAALPVRCRVYARFTTAGTNTGTVRFQSTARSWVDVNVNQATIGTTWTWVTVTGWIETNIAADDDAAVLIDLVKTTGDTLEIRYWSVCFGELEVGV